MKKIILISSLILNSVAFGAQKNPQIRTCNSLGGVYLVASTNNDQVGLCQLDKAIVGALDLTLFNNKEAITQSLNSYMKKQTNCEPAGQIQLITIVGGQSLKVCTYFDSSMIELATQLKGLDSSDNEKLNQALGL